MDGLIALISVGLLIWFWFDSLQARETALHGCKTACQQTNTQLLDQTVALCGIGVGRRDGRQLMIRRKYRFEFSTDGADRWYGRVVVLGSYLETLQMDHEEGATITHFGKREV